jgi:methylenetetrahydrofolate dehydrogenase (NADP+) / methenyltetrahydrofolate cyclohydrolase
MTILDGKLVASKMYQKLQGDVLELKNKNILPKLVIVIVGEDPASLSYIKSKKNASEKTGIESEIISLKADETTTQSLITMIHDLNENPLVHGILIQLPLPSHIFAPEVIKAIHPQKDVDGFTAYNLGKMFLSTDYEQLAPCTPLGIIRMMEHYNIAIEGKEVVVVGRSNIVGKPISMMLLNRGATVTVCHSKTKDLEAHTKRADILIVAVGKAGFIKEEMVKEGAVVIDVGINRTKEGKLVGDVDFEKVKDIASYITPVPGGCGLMTVASLIENTVKAAKRLNNIP